MSTVQTPTQQPVWSAEVKAGTTFSSFSSTKAKKSFHIFFSEVNDECNKTHSGTFIGTDEPVFNSKMDESQSDTELRG